MAFENTNLECKKILGPLKVRSAPIDEWILHIRKVETFNYSTEAWVGEVISSGMRKNQNAKCFNCVRIRHLRMNCRQGIPRNNVSSRNGINRRTQPSGICTRCGKACHWTNECRSTKDRQDNLTPWGVSLADPHVQQGQVIPSQCGKHVSPEKLNKPMPTVRKHVVLDDGINMEDEAKTPVGNRMMWECHISIC